MSRACSEVANGKSMLRKVVTVHQDRLGVMGQLEGLGTFHGTYGRLVALPLVKSGTNLEMKR